MGTTGATSDNGVLNGPPPIAGAGDPAAVHVRAKLDEQLRALVANDEIARAGTDPEGVHQMRVAVRRLRAAIKAEGSSLGDATGLQAELKWLGGALGPVRDLDVLLEMLHEQTADFTATEAHAVRVLLSGLVGDRKAARRRMLTALRGKRYQALLRALTAAAASEPVAVGGNGHGEPQGTHQDLVGAVRKPLRRLRAAADALGDDPPDELLHALRIHGKRLRYAAELSADTGGKAATQLIKATKGLQDVLGEHQDAVVAEQRIRAMLADLGESLDPAVAFVAGRLVERERTRRAACRARWRADLAAVVASAGELLAAH